MKKNLLLVALAGVALASCVKNDVVVPQEKSVKIGFATPVLNSNVNTRAEVYGEIGSHQYTGSTTVYSYPREEQFRIFAVEHNENFTSWTNATATAFNEQSISYNSSLDAWAPRTTDGGYYYWPDGEKLSFAAMSPAELDVTGATVSYGATGLTVENFVVADNPDTQYDLLYSERALNKTAADVVNSGASYYSGIPIIFKHALSSIHFSLETDATETITLTKITLKQASNKGTFNENITNETNLTRDPQWTIATDAAKKDYVSFTGAVNFPLNAQYVSALAAMDGTDDGDVSYPLLLIPQTIGNDMIVEVKYKVGSEEKTRNVQLNKYPSTNPIVKWNVGTKYTYRLVYSKAAQKQDIIYFSPSTEEWAEGGIIVVTL